MLYALLTGNTPNFKVTVSLARPPFHHKTILCNQLGQWECSCCFVAEQPVEITSTAIAPISLQLPIIVVVTP